MKFKGGQPRSRSGSKPGWSSPQAAGAGPGRPFSSGSGQGPKRESFAPSRKNLGLLMRRYGVELSPAILSRLWEYHQLLRKHNRDRDLTRLIGFDTIAQRHYADCMILHGMLGGKWPSPLADIGTGAGFPGIMIKLISPETTLVLAEPRPRRVEFLELVIRELGLKDVSVFPHKVTSKSFTLPMAGCISRAFESVEKTLPRLGGALPKGGKVIFMKGPNVGEEIKELALTDYRIIRNQPYRIPKTTLDRVLLILEKIR